MAFLGTAEDGEAESAHAGAPQASSKELRRFPQVRVVIEAPATQYAEFTDGSYIAYQIVGDGPPDLMFIGDFGSNLDLVWEFPSYAHVFRRFASFSRLIRFDLRGTGMSDPLALGEQPTLEDRAKEILAVLDAVGSTQAAVVSNGAYGLFAIFFAATYPERTSALVLDGCFARLAWAPDYPIGIPMELLNRTVAAVPTKRAYAGLRFAAPSAMSDPEFVTLYERSSRSQRPPAVTRALTEVFVSTDLREALPAIQAPTLVLHRRDDRWVRRPQAEYLAQHIDGARLVGLPGEDNLIFFGDSDVDVDEIEEFVTGSRRSPERNRVLATVLFTDIVGSTELAAQVGDRRFKEVLDSYDRAVHRQLGRFGGKMVNTAGDGIFATFDGPGRAIRCACAIRDAVGTLGIDVRSGLHTGEIELRGDDATGMAVHIGARVSALAGDGEVFVSSTVRDLVAGSGIEFEDRGEHQLKGVPGTWRLSAVKS